MGELAISLAHEIRQPISAAVINAKTCLRWLDRQDLTEARGAALRTIEDVVRASDFVSRLGLLCKKTAIQPESFDVNEIIREMMALLSSEANGYSISINGDLAPNLPRVFVDRAQLQQVLMNLMLNGIDAMKEVSGRNELTIRSKMDDGQLVVSVSDTGTGIPAQQSRQIFEAFYTSKPDRIGMGLPISRSIIESHGGRLWATNNPGPGASFHFTLPAGVAAHA
jgi:signal transduction histidine kinase